MKDDKLRQCGTPENADAKLARMDKQIASLLSDERRRRTPTTRSKK
jgi:hypothetical protein